MYNSLSVNSFDSNNFRRINIRYNRTKGKLTLITVSVRIIDESIVNSYKQKKI